MYHQASRAAALSFGMDSIWEAAKSASISPSLPPAAEMWALTVMLLMLEWPASVMISASVTATISQTPASRHDAPQRSRQSIPLMIERFCSGGLPRPRFLRLIGSKSFRMRHSASVRSPRLKPAFDQPSITTSIKYRCSG